MAFIQSSGKRNSLNIDLTPMVDLNFLLITFFMLTTSMARPKAIELQMPYKPPKNPSVFYETSAITLIPSSGHLVYYYEGMPDDPIRYKMTDFSADGLCDILIRKQKSIATMPDPRLREVQVLIKPAGGATLNDLVQVLDEMKILSIKCYAITDITPGEILALSNMH